jgi:hypothetical protein
MVERRTLITGSGIMLAVGLVIVWLRTPREPGQAHVASGAESALDAAPMAPSPPLESPSVRAPTTAEPAPARAALDSKPADENAYLHAVWELHDTDKPRALELVRKGDAWYSNHGVAAEARKAMAITLLVELGQMEPARAEVRRFITAYPDSRYLPMVEGVTGIHPRPTGPNTAP